MFTVPTTAPDFIRDETHFNGEKIVGWRFITRERADDPTRTERCGYQLVTENGIYEFDLVGVGVRATSLHPTNHEYPDISGGFG